MFLDTQPFFLFFFFFFNFNITKINILGSVSYRLWVCTAKGNESTKQKRNAVDWRSDWVWYKHLLQDQIGLFCMRSVGVGHLRPVHSNIPPLCLIPHSERDGAGGHVLSLSTSFQWIALLRVCVFSLHLLWLDRKLRKPVYYSSIAGLHLLPLANGFTCNTTERAVLHEQYPHSWSEKQ